MYPAQPPRDTPFKLCHLHLRYLSIQHLSCPHLHFFSYFPLLWQPSYRAYYGTPGDTNPNATNHFLPTTSLSYFSRFPLVLENPAVYHTISNTLLYQPCFKAQAQREEKLHILRSSSSLPTVKLSVREELHYTLCMFGKNLRIKRSMKNFPCSM